MNSDAVLAAFNQQLRRNPEPESREMLVELDDRVVRNVSAGWTGVTWSDLNEANADAVIAEQVRRFTGRSWEWKHYSYDQPADLPERLIAAGFTAEEPEALLVAEITDLDLDVRPPDGIELVPVVDERTAELLVSVHDEVFGGDHSEIGRTVLKGLEQRPTTVQAVLAMAGDIAVSAGRVEFRLGTDFASIWGGGTLREWRGRGVFRSLVAYRAELAAARGFRYLQVDASPDSRPILRRLGFVELATTTPYTHP
jgi:ribosomal protein S18 acetylase RimI-like enzyme